jgi:hypothetical protein
MKVLELTYKDEQTFLQLLDIAVKAGGLNVAQQALVLAHKMKEVEDVEDAESSD